MKLSVMTTTTAGDRAAAVTKIYEAFGRGDVPSILDRIATDCAWESWSENSAQRAGVPTLQARTGPAGVADFFAAVGELTIHDFRVLDVMAGEFQVAVEVTIDVSTPSGGRYADEELHLWTLDDRGLVTRMRHYVDTAKHIDAFR